jgi:hypothetical protein
VHYATFENRIWAMAGAMAAPLADCEGNFAGKNDFMFKELGGNLVMAYPCCLDQSEAVACAANVPSKKIRKVVFVDPPVVHEHVIPDKDFKRQTPPTGFKKCAKKGKQKVVNEMTLYHSSYALAVARSKALDLRLDVLLLLPDLDGSSKSGELASINTRRYSCHVRDRVCDVLRFMT